MTNEEYIQQIIAQAPPLTEERRAFLSQISAKEVSRMKNCLTQREVAELLNVSERTIQWWRQRGYFPQPGYVGRRPVYRREVVDEWLAQQASL